MPFRIGWPGALQAGLIERVEPGVPAAGMSSWLAAGVVEAAQAPDLGALSQRVLQRMPPMAEAVARLCKEPFDAEPAWALVLSEWARSLPPTLSAQRLLTRYPRFGLLSGTWCEHAGAAGPGLAALHAVAWPWAPEASDPPAYRASLLMRRLLETWPPGVRWENCEAGQVIAWLEALDVPTQPRWMEKLSKLVDLLKEGAADGWEGHGAGGASGGGGVGAGSFPPSGLSIAVQPSVRDAWEEAQGEDGEEDASDGEELLTLHEQVPGMGLAVACSPRLQRHVSEAVETEGIARRVRPGRWSLGEHVALLRIAEKQREINPALWVVLRGVGSLGIPWSALPTDLRPLAPHAIGSTGHSGLCVMRDARGQVHALRVSRLPPLPPPPPGTDHSLLYPVERVLPLPVIPALAEELWESLSRLDGGVEHEREGLRWLQWPTKGLRIATFDQAVGLRTQRFVRDDAGRVESLFGQILRDMGVDQSSEHVLTGVRGGYRAQDHYWNREIVRLQSEYIEAQCRIVTPGVRAFLVPLPGPWTDAASARVGSPRVPLPASVKRSATALIAAVGDTRPPRGNRDPAAWARYHNARVCAFALVLSVAWAVRRSRTALQQPEATVLMPDGWILLRDKGELRRALPVTRVLYTITGYWRAHLHRLHRAAVAQALGWERMRHDAPLGVLWSPFMLTMVEPARIGWRRRPWQPADTDAALAASGIALPVQLMRQAASVMLLERREAACESRYRIDAVMGHYRFGREPESAWSHLSFEALVVELTECVDGVLEQAGITGATW